MERRAIIDTSAVLTLFSALHLREEKIQDLELIVPKCVEKELDEFKEHGDYLGERAREASEKISVKENPLSEKELERERESLGLGKGGITNCDVQVLHLAFDLDLPFFTDDFSAHRHFVSHYPSKNIFFGILLTLDILGFEDVSRAKKFVFERLVPKRFPEITDRTKSNLTISIDEFLLDS